MPRAEDLDDYIFNLKFQSKQMRREADKQIKESYKVRLKAKKDMYKGNREAAQIYAQYAISHLNFNAKYVKMACRMEVIAGQLKTQQVNANVTKEIDRLNQVVKSCVNPEALLDNAKVMTHFNNICEMMGIQQKMVENMMGGTDSQQSVSYLLGQLETEIAAEQSAKIENVPQVQQPQEVVDANKQEIEALRRRLENV